MAEEIIDKLVSKQALDELEKLNTELVACFDEMEKVLGEVQKVSEGFGVFGKSLSEINKGIDEYGKVVAKIETIEERQLKILQEKEKLTQQVLKTEVQEQKAAQEKIKTKQAETKASEQQARATKKEEDARKSAEGSINKMRQAMAALVVEYNRADEATRKKLAPAIRDLQEKVNAANADIGRSQGYVGQYERALSGLGKTMAGLGRQMDKLQSPMIGFGKQLIKSLGLIVGIGMLAKVLKGATSTIVEFEQANVNLSTILGKNVKEITALTESAKRLGASTEWMASQVTELQTELAKLGFNEQQILDMQASILSFATATGADLANAASLAGAALRMFGLQSKDTNKVVSAMTVATNKSALSFSYLDSALSTVGPVAKAFGFTIEDTISLLGTLANAGFDASSAATATRNILLNLADANGKLAKELGKPVKTIPELVAGLKELRTRGINLADALELTDKRSVAAFNTFVDGTDVLIELRKQLEDTSGELDRIVNERINTVDGSVKLLKSSWEALMLSFSNSKGAMKTVVDGLASVINWINKAITAADDAKSKLNKTSWWKQTVEDTRTNEAEILTKRFEELKEKGLTSKEIYEHEKAQAKKFLDEQQALMDEFQKNRQKSIEMGIIKESQWSKSDREFWIKTQMAIETTTASLQVLEDVYKGFKPVSTEVPSGLGIVDEKAQKAAEKAAEKARREEEKRTKELAANIESLGLIEMFRLKKSAEANKEIIDDDKRTYAERRAAVEAMLSFEIQAINKQKEAEIKAVDERLKGGVISATTAANQRVLITEKTLFEVEKLEVKSAKELNKLNKQEADLKVKNIQEAISARSEEINRAMQDELVNAAKSYEQQTALNINSEQRRNEIAKEYQKQRLEIIRQYNQIAFEFEMEQLKKTVDELELNEEKKSDIRKKMNELEKKNAKEIADYEINQTQLKIDAMLSLEEKFNKFLHDERTKTAQSAWNIMLDTMNMYYDEQLNRIDALEKREKEYYDDKLKMIDENVEAGLMSEEEAAARKRIIDEEQLLKEKEYERQRKDMQRKQALWQKANASIQAIINTALAVTSAIATPPAPLGIALAAIVGAMGAAQIAMINSQSVPKYAHGTDEHRGGFARVGDAGRSEMVIFPSGETWKTPARDTLTWLPKGTEILPDFKAALANMIPVQIPATVHNESKDTFDDVLRKSAKETNNRLSNVGSDIKNIGLGVQKIRANSRYSEKRAYLMYRLNKYSRNGNA